MATDYTRIDCGSYMYCSTKLMYTSLALHFN